MKNTTLLIVCTFLAISGVYAQDSTDNTEQRQQIVALVDAYAQAREQHDTVLLKSILTEDIDQLVSSGEWRTGKKESMEGMQQSATENPGTRTLKVEKIRFLNPGSALADARYEIANPDGTVRKMWSTFIVVYHEENWKIAAIRNMLPASPQ